MPMKWYEQIERGAHIHEHGGIWKGNEVYVMIAGCVSERHKVLLRARMGLPGQAARPGTHLLARPRSLLAAFCVVLFVVLILLVIFVLILTFLVLVVVLLVTIAFPVPAAASRPCVLAVVGVVPAGSVLVPVVALVVFAVVILPFCPFLVVLMPDLHPFGDSAIVGRVRGGPFAVPGTLQRRVHGHLAQILDVVCSCGHLCPVCLLLLR